MSDRPQDDPMIGRTLADRYRIDEPVARGGMARVFRARDTRLERDVAIKILSSPYADDPDFIERFLGEARAAASLSHPSLVHVYDSGTDGDAHFIVMELLDSHRSLREELDERGRLPRDEVLRMAQELLAGLAVVHEHGLVHCDVKAGNVMLGPGPAKLIDFGIARSPRDSDAGDTSIGSLQFMSPEQLHGEALGPESDLFSLGVVLYQALTGTEPYPGTTAEEVSSAHRSGAVRPPSTLVDGVPGRLDEAILQALRREPASRFRSAGAMSRALDAAAAAIRIERDDEETRVVRTSPAPPEPPSADRGYVPPPSPEYDDPPPAAPRAPQRRTGSRGMAGLLGPLAILGAAVLVIVVVVVPLLQLGRTGGAGESSPAAPAATATVPPDTIPDTIGLPTDEAIELAERAGLDWTVRCNEDPSRPEGIIDQEPPAGTSVSPGSAFTMFSARITDCR